MANFPRKPQKGQKALQSIYNTVCDIVDYLPSLNVVGDNKTTSVNHSNYGTTIHAIQPNTTIQSKSNDYIAGSGIIITNGNIINARLSAGPNINIDYNSGWLVISGTPAGSGTPPGPGGQEYYDGRFITISSDFSINCTLSALSELYNPPFVESSNIVMPNSLTACNNTVDISQVGSIYNDHFIQTRDILYDGVGTKVSLAWMRNPFGDQDPGGTNGIVQGLQVDLTLSGGRFADVVLHKHVYGAYDPNTGTRYDPPTESRVDCLLTGTYDRYPHTSGFIDVVPVEMEDGKTWGVISTNLHAGSGITIDPQTGEISCDGGGGGTTIIASGIGQPNYALLYNGNYGVASGIGISFLVPVSAGQTYRYYTDARNEIEPEQEGGETTYQQLAYGTYAPSVGETGDERREIVNGDEFVPSANGWLRISVFDDGTHQGSCLRMYQGENADGYYATPLYRFHGFEKYSEGAGISIESGIISCMIQTDRNDALSGITSAALTTVGQNPVMTGIAIGLSTQFAEDLFAISGRLSATTNEDRILSSHNGTLLWAENNSTSPTWTSLTPSLLAVDNTNHTLSAATQSGGGGGGGTGGGAGWPKWENMCGSGHLVYVQQWYTTQDGGWLRISNKEDTTYGGCNSLYIDPVVPPAGVEGKNHIGLGTGRVSFFIPVPPGSSFWIGLNQGAQCWFDGTTTPPTHTTEDAILPQQIRDNSTSAVEACSVASSKCSEAESNANSMKNDYEGYVGQDNLYDPQWYKDHYYATIDNSNEATAAKNSCISYANACQTAYNSYDRPDKANYTQYVTDANNAVTDATSYATSAATQIDVASQYYDLAYDYWQAHHPQWFVENPDYTKYNQ